ncbi:ATP-binding protein [Pseudomonas graminis]|uniref:ATP-binding protein n=1 Tax=Pseudomonas graminis TaxID=158627 RepID=A0A6M8M2P3_9PSED|nr:ATP-binding protein [Pseudomonas graminis]QKF49334.1 hypothetical protein FX982_00253 [Pseudomonas graminis]
MSNFETQKNGGQIKLSDVVKISRQFLRSVRLDADLGRDDALSGYICQGTSRAVLENMARQLVETRQRAFTWTGPYGGGKSSLALLLCSLLGSNKEHRQFAEKILRVSEHGYLAKAFETKGDGWLILPVVGKRSGIESELFKALQKTHAPIKRKKTSSVIDDLVDLANSHDQGVLIVIDELGKFLEAAALHDGDIYFYQELAEAASRCNGKLVIVGILHQAFEAYATRLGRETRDEWAKIQGRFIDIPLVSATDEIIELVGNAIELTQGLSAAQDEKFCTVVHNSISARRPNTPKGLTQALARCWPLHPITASLLGPISRRRFGQNERSTFGFLASREPMGFVDFLESTPYTSGVFYDPSDYWDYLRTNLEQSIMASPDSHRWAVACDAVDRAESKGTKTDVRLAKVVALIEMFRSGSGLAAEYQVLLSSLPDIAEVDLRTSIDRLINLKIIVERKHIGAFGIYAGSDFDIDAAINQARYEIGKYSVSQISNLSILHPILAKRLYQTSGTMRWFSKKLVQITDVESLLNHFSLERGSAGTFLLCLPEFGQTVKEVKKYIRLLNKKFINLPVIMGCPDNAERIAELSLELAASDRVIRTRSELEGDSVAKREVTGRISFIKSELEDELTNAFMLTSWHYKGQEQTSTGSQSISSLASVIAEEIYYKSPTVLNELINRESLSSNSNKARKDLMYRMVTHFSEENLGYTGHPADAGLYYSVLQNLGLHGLVQHGWNFVSPTNSKQGTSLLPLWWDTEKMLLQGTVEITLSYMYESWSKPPYGLRAGLMPVFALAFFLANRTSLAMYIDGTFTPEISDASIDEWLLSPSKIIFRYISASKDKQRLVDAIANIVPITRVDGAQHAEPLDAARSLVGTVYKLPAWTKKTHLVSQLAQDIRAVLLKANDPHKVLFSDLPTMLEAETPEELTEKLTTVLAELENAYPKMLAKIDKAVLSTLGQQDKDLIYLNMRAKNVKGIAGNFLLEAFATRIEVYDGTRPSIEKVISLATSKPPEQWVDRDIDAAISQIGSWAIEFRTKEAMAPLHGRPSTRRVMGIVFGGRQSVDASSTIDIAEKDGPKVDEIKNRLLSVGKLEDRDLFLAALAEVGAFLINDQGRTPHD